MFQDDHTALQAENVSKKFLLGRRSSSLKDKFTGASERNREDFWAFRDVSVTVPKGSMLGVIGRNGSGKSTFLRTLCGVYRPTEGRVLVRGRVTALLELGAGFHSDLTGRENIYMNGSIVGHSRDFMDDAMDEIIEMADIGSFIDAPISTYSSGMRARLGFSVSVQMQPEILLADEITAVGDITFKQHGIRRMNELREGGATIVQVSHSLSMLRKHCDQILWLHHGEVRLLGDPAEVIDEYKAHSEVDTSGRMIGEEVVPEPTSGNEVVPARKPLTKRGQKAAIELIADEKNTSWFRAASLLGDDGTDPVAGESATLSVELNRQSDLANPELTIEVLAGGGRTTGFGYRSGPLSGSELDGPIKAAIDGLSLTAGRYFLRINLLDGGEVVATHHEPAAVLRPDDDAEVAQLDAKWGVPSHQL